MRIGSGVEWAMHCCLSLAWVGPETAVSAAKLAAYYQLPMPYLNKQLQALARAGVVSSTPGPRGGFRLAREPDRITSLDVVVAIEGATAAFRCTEILRHAPGGDPDGDYRNTCAISQTMRRADLAWRRELAAQTLADLRATVERRDPAVRDRVRTWFTT